MAPIADSIAKSATEMANDLIDQAKQTETVSNLIDYHRRVEARKAEIAEEKTNAHVVNDEFDRIYRPSQFKKSDPPVETEAGVANAQLSYEGQEILTHTGPESNPGNETAATDLKNHKLVLVAPEEGDKPSPYTGSLPQEGPDSQPGNELTFIGPDPPVPINTPPQADGDDVGGRQVPADAPSGEFATLDKSSVAGLNSASKMMEKPHQSVPTASEWHGYGLRPQPTFVGLGDRPGEVISFRQDLWVLIWLRLANQIQKYGGPSTVQSLPVRKFDVREILSSRTPINASLQYSVRDLWATHIKWLRLPGRLKIDASPDIEPERGIQ